MKPIRIVLCALALAGMTPRLAHAYSSTVDNLFAPIPDGDLNGYENSQTVSGVAGPVQHVSVSFNITGGLNGDLYAYLFHNNTSATLLNRVGRSSTSNLGYPDTGFGPDAGLISFTLDDLASYDIHRYRTVAYTLNGAGQLTGRWQPDGRALDPLSAGSLFDSAPRSNPLSVFNGMDPNGTWSLFVADASSGFESTLVGWTLNIDVPEPGSAALLVGALAAMLVARKTRISQG